MSKLTDDVMKLQMKRMIKVNVLSSKPRMSNDNPLEQERDRDGDKLWNVSVLEKVFNPEHEIEETVISDYKSTIELPKGNHVVELQSTEMGQASTNSTYVAINRYYKIVRKVEDAVKVGDMFSLQGTIPPTKRKAAESKQMAAQ